MLEAICLRYLADPVVLRTVRLMRCNRLPEGFFDLSIMMAAYPLFAARYPQLTPEQSAEVFGRNVWTLLKNSPPRTRAFVQNPEKPQIR